MPDDLLRRFIGVVRGHYAAPNAPPLLLSTFGHTNGPLLRELKEVHGTLKAAIAAASEELRIIDATVGRETIAPVDMAEQLERRVREASAEELEGVSSFDSLPLSVRLAFCVRTEADQRVALDTTPPFHFEKTSEPDLIRASQRLIPEHLRKPGLSLNKASPSDRAALWRNFRTWATEANVQPSTFAIQRPTNALSRLIGAQKPGVMDQLVIPGDIAALLLKYP